MRAARYLLGLSLLLFAGCREYSQADYDLALKNGVAAIEVADQFNALYPDSHNFITYYRGKSGRPKWTSKIGLHGRYIVSVKFDLKFDRVRQNPSRSTEPKFRLIEASKVERTPEGRLSISYSSNQIRFGLDGWKKILAADGDLSVVGYTVEKDRPHAEFSEVWR